MTTAARTGRPRWALSEAKKPFIRMFGGVWGAGTAKKLNGTKSVVAAINAGTNKRFNPAKFINNFP